MPPSIRPRRARVSFGVAPIVAAEAGSGVSRAKR